MTPCPGASDPKPTFQELVLLWASVQYFKFIRGSGAPRVPRAAARRALLLLLLALLLLLLLFALLLLAARCCSPRARAPARLPARPPARRPAASAPPTCSAHQQQQQRVNEHKIRHQKQVDSAAALTPVGPVGRPPGFRLAVVGARALCAPWGPTLGRRCAPESLREAAGLRLSGVKRSQKQMVMPTVLAPERFMT